MTTIQFILLIVVAGVAGMGSVLDECQFHRPLVACTLVGLVLGDITTGIILGGTLEMLALGWMNVGAAMAPDAALASVVSAILVIIGHQSIGAGIALAVPLAAAGQVLTIFVRTITVFFQHLADRFALEGNTFGIEMCHVGGLLLQGTQIVARQLQIGHWVADGGIGIDGQALCFQRFTHGDSLARIANDTRGVEVNVSQRREKSARRKAIDVVVDNAIFAGLERPGGEALQ